MNPLVLLAAGGTGGHLFAAEALAASLAKRQMRVELVTDDRALRYGRSFPAGSVHAVASDTLRGRSPEKLARFAMTLGRGFVASVGLLRRTRPAVVVGFGGYPTVPPVLAASVLGIPTIIHEQNAVMGRANRLLARGAGLVATGFPELRGAPKLRRPFVHVGNPVRASVLAEAGKPFHAPASGERIGLLVFGGSQGARVMADIVPDAIAALPEALRTRLAIVQQTRAEDLDRVGEAYRAVGIEAVLSPFIGDLPTRMAQAHLVIARSGASTVAELGVIGRPSILVPFPHALDQDQLANATVLERAGGATVVTEDRFNSKALAGLLEELLLQPQRLAGQAAASLGIGVPDAAERLADLVLTMAEGGAPGTISPDISGTRSADSPLPRNIHP